jgi:hypothetical protein
MGNDQFFPKWHLVDQPALSGIQQMSTSAGIHQLSTGALPAQLHGMPGAVSCFVSAYSSPIPIGSNTVAGGEMAVVRTDGAAQTAYNYVLASSGEGRVYFNGPFKDFPQHHFSSSSLVSVENPFGKTPVDTKGSV